MTDLLKSPPYQWFGGKAKVAPLIWQRFGDVPNYVEPFFGGGAVWRLRPHWPFDERVIRRETINDYDGHVCNFWRAVQADPEAVAHYLDWPVSELDLHARGAWLFCRPESREFIERMRADPEHCDAKTAGWWCWFVCNWIGGLPAVEKNAHRTADSVYKKRPHLGNAGKGVCAETTASLVEWMLTLADRLRRVRVCCGDWSRVCGRSVTWDNASPCAVFLDPPYGLGFMGKDRDCPGGVGDFPMRRTEAANTVNTGASRQGGRQRSCTDWAKRQARDMQAYQTTATEWGEAMIRVNKPLEQLTLLSRRPV